MTITAQQLQDLNKTTLPPLGPRVAMAALITIAVVATIIFPGSAVGLAIVAVALIASMVVWWRYLRGAGLRLNNYDPLKPDAEVERSAFDWKEEGRLLVMFLIVFSVINVGSMINSIPLTAAFAGLTFVCVLWGTNKNVTRPGYYVFPDVLYAEQPDFSVPRDERGLVAAMHALMLVPGGSQMHNTVLLERLDNELGWTRADSERALRKAISNGTVVSIRELRLRDDAITWLTLTPKSFSAYQNDVKEGQAGS